MTIDEIIKELEKASDYLLNAVGGYPLNGAEEKMINSVDAAIEFIEWYCSQDLIRREDIPKYELWCSARRNETTFNTLIEQIPKAELPKGE